MKKKLSPKQARFVTEYLIDLNATQAAERAGYSKKTAGAIGAENLKKPQIAEALADRQTKRFQKREITADWILDEIYKVAAFDVRRLYGPDGELLDIPKLDDDTAASVAGVEVNELFEGDGDQKHAYGLNKKIKLADKLRALEMLGRHKKLFTDKTEATVDEGQMSELLDAIRRS
jgi:phage terminase small subunit